MNMKSKTVFTLILLLATITIAAETYNFNNDYLYNRILKKYNIMARNWCMAQKIKTPVQLQEFKVAAADIVNNSKGKSLEGYLIPLEVLVFRNNGFYEYYWLKNDSDAGSISGSWKIENSMLIITLSKNYVNPYLKGKELRYEITGSDQLQAKLFFKGVKYPPITGIIETSNDPLDDLNKIIIAMEQKIVSEKFPEIIKKKELELRESILKNKKAQK